MPACCRQLPPIASVLHPLLALLLLLLQLLSNGCDAVASLKDKLDQCKPFCPAQCPLCEFRYTYAQYHLQLDCAFAARSGADAARLFDCPWLSELHVLIASRLDRPRPLLMKLPMLPKLAHLNLSDNRIEHLPSGSFDKFFQLKQLILDNNRLENVTEGSVAAESLQRLSLRGNRIGHVHHLAFSSPANSLTYIDLSHNRLQSVTNWPLRIERRKAGERLRILLDYNRIRRFDDTDGSNDETLRALSHLHWTKELIDRTRLTLSLANNRIEHLIDIVRGWNMDDKTIRELGLKRAITIASLRHNPLVCDCRDYEMYVSPSNISSLLPDPLALPYCKNPRSLKYRSAFNSAFQLMMKHSELVCREQCINSKCICTQEPWRRTLSVDCYGAALGRLPHRREMPPLPQGYAFRFNFSASRLQRTLPGMPSVYREARTLDLRGTGLDTLPIKYFNKLRAIEVMNLNHNLFTALDRRITELPFPHLKQLRLDHNPWDCRCNNSWMLYWLRTMRPYLRNEDQIRCARPAELANTQLLLLNRNHLCGRQNAHSSNRSYDRIALSSSAISAALAFVTVCVFFVFCTRVSLFTKFGFHPFDRDECDGELKRCDAFLLFHPNDADWVVSVLVEKLTNRKNPFALCTHDRACIPGLLTYNAVCHAVENSKRVIAVITDSFVSDVDVCTDYQLSVTFLARTQPRQSNRLIHILFPNVRTVPRGLIKQSLTAKTVIRYGRKKFWKEVLYRMPLTTVNQLSASKPCSLASASATAATVAAGANSAQDYSSSFHILNEDQRNSLLAKAAHDYCISYSNVYDHSGERPYLPGISGCSAAASMSSLNIYPTHAGMLSLPLRSSRMSTFRSPEQQFCVGNLNEATL